MTHRYDIKLDFDSPNSYYKILTNITPQSKALEVGTSSGYVTKYLKENLDCVVDGVEIDKSLIQEANKYARRIWNEDLNKIKEWIDLLPNEEYDYILMMDVLEHIYSPFEVIDYLKPKIKKDGLFVVSIPNVSHASILMQLLTNTFTYTETGILDYTHIRFYTCESFIDMVKKHELHIYKTDFTYMTPSYSLLNQDYLDINIDQREVILKKPNSHAFQSIIFFSKVELPNSNPLPYQSLTNYYNQLIILNNDNTKAIFHCHQPKEKIKFISSVDSNCIKFIPSIRKCKYKLNQIKINGVDIVGKCNFVIKKTYLNTKDKILKIIYPLKQNDVVEIFIEYIYE